MKARITAAILILIVVSMCSFIGFGRSDAGDKSQMEPKTGVAVGGNLGETPAVPEQDFGDKVLMLYMRPNQADVNGVNHTPILEKAKVRRLGERTYLVGKMPDQGEMGKGFNGTTVWVATSEIMQITEHESVAALREYVEAVGKAGGAKK